MKLEKVQILWNIKIIKRIKDLYPQGRDKYYVQSQLMLEGFSVETLVIVYALSRKSA